MRILISALLIGFLATGAAAQFTSQTVEKDWGQASFAWSNQDKVLVRFQSFVQDGAIGVCVAYASRGGLAIKLNKAALKEAKIVIGDKTILRNLNFGRQHSSRAFGSLLVGLDAQCFVTKTKAPSGGFQTRIEWREGRYRVDK